MAPTTPTTVLPFHGYVETTGDALRLVQAARCGLIPRITRRLNELERRAMIRSGAVFVFSVEESGIRRWTEGLQWSPSRIAGNFLVYREVTERGGSRGTARPGASEGARMDGQGVIKPNGLTKKTITVKIDGSDHHLICYYTAEDVELGRLQRPTNRPDIMALEIPPELVQSTNFRYPPKIEPGPDGRLTRIRDSEEGSPDRSSSSPVDPVRMPTGLAPSGEANHVYSRHAIHSSDGMYGANDSRRHPATYATPVPPSRSHSHPTVQTHGLNAYYNPNVHSHSPPTSPTSSQWGSSNYMTYDVASDSPTLPYSYGSEANQTYVQSSSMHQQEWEQHAAVASHVDEYSTMNVGQHTIGGQPMNALASGQPLSGQLIHSAPPVSSPTLPTVHRDEHMRTRSVPSTTWSLNHQSSMNPHYQLPPVVLPGETSYRPSMSSPSDYHGHSRMEARGGSSIRSSRR
ncbi:hypothetical protein K474DRAFT_1708362 [Panus rudis PR-1116 ss-1]|nr:hypothetical protein K474DRAFT_1708362 [Panus rudis PR-1116 ss-1]